MKRLPKDSVLFMGLHNNFRYPNTERNWPDPDWSSHPFHSGPYFDDVEQAVRLWQRKHKGNESQVGLYLVRTDYQGVPTLYEIVSTKEALQRG